MAGMENLEGIQYKKVLVVDDDMINVILTKNFLYSTGIAKENIFIAKDGCEALEIIKQRLFDIILMDVEMPGVCGIEVSQKIRSYYPENTPKIIGYTANMFIHEVPGAKEVFDDIILKPISKNNFSAKILEILNSDDKQNKHFGQVELENQAN